MADIKIKYGTSAQAITITLASLANAAAREGLAINNAVNLFLDALVQVKVKTNAAGTSATGYVRVYAAGSVDGGTTYSGEAGGTDAAVTLLASPNVRLLGVFSTVANATTYESQAMSVAQAFGGVLPERWSIIVENRSGAALDSVAGGHSVLYQGVLGQTV